MILNLDNNTPFNLDYTLSCGQVFRWCRTDEGWLGIVDGSIVTIVQNENHLTFHMYPEDKGKTFIKRYFRLDDDLPRIISTIRRDETISNAVDVLHGLRLVRQDPWECLISFICATYTNIPRIRGMVENLSRKFGERIESEYGTFHAFPSRDTLAKATLVDLKECGLGFRSKYVLETVQTIQEGFNLECLRKLCYEDAEKRLLTLPGVGRKVADCVLLFSLDKLDAFPVDVWISRIMERYYPSQLASLSSLAKDKRIGVFGRLYFSTYAGYAQEYLYHHYKEKI